ncbi:hypothetical protein ANCDUO_03941 [Ancylostoma duodenale]|uniref:Membrane-associated protein gex-3 family protein n=1 Tax=Ancylostoma duodenale TaxID=51022 RepID=A0A0C2H8B3_9BILA|nr:hypothetical protein ANCDUO_03941 [Ancylostoma duodenale]
MAFKMESSQLKIAEKLVILNDRAVGMLTRIYNIKKACADSKSKPAFLADKHMENAIKHVARKFPVVDARMNTSTFHYVDTMKEDIIKSLGLYYYTFADLMELKDNILQLLTTMDACQCQLDISLNYELTAGYLNLVVNLICLMVLLSRVDDRKVVLGLFNAAYDLLHGQSESSFPRLGQMILDYEHPMRKLSEDLGPLNRLISSALSSLSPVYLRRNITANTWRNAQILSLTANPQQILYAAQTDTIACEYLSLDVMDRWIVSRQYTLIVEGSFESLCVNCAYSLKTSQVLWLLRHLSEWPSSSKKASKQCDELVDRQLPELLYYMLELRQLVTKYSDVIQRYYLKYVNGYDAIMTRELVSNINDLNEDDAAILSDFASSISSINSDTDLRALRLDWFRFQARTSMARSPFLLTKNRKLAIIMNTNVFHLKMIDLQDEMLKETSDLSVYCSALHDMCPEEKNHILEKSLALCNSILDDVCQSITDVVGALCEYELRLAEQTSPSTIAAQIVSQMLRSKGGKNAAAAAQKDPTPAGEESYRVDRQTLTYPDKLQTTLILLCLVELCAGVSQYRQLFVSDHFFAPREYLSQHIEHKFVDLILAMAVDPASPSTPRRPSDLLMIIQAYMTVLQNIDACVPLDITRLFNNVLLQQTQPLDSRNKETMTYIYTKWYLEVVLRRASAGHMLWSEHLQAMISSGEGIEFAPEQYTDPRELRCLAQIIGPYGVKYLAERLTWHVASQIGELNKIVLANRDVLHTARTNFDCNERMKEVMQVLAHEPKEKKGSTSSPADAILQRTSIIGQIFSFRDALHTALEQALGELGAAMGMQGPIDIALSNAVRAQSLQINPDEHYQMSCLLLVAIAISLPKLATVESATYKPSLRASLNNTHCIPLAVNTMAGALFHHHGRGDIHLRMKEFLALASSSVLRAAQEMDGRQDAINNQSALYIMLEQLVNKCRWLSMDVLEACFPYNLVRTAYQHCYQQEADTFQ